MIANSIDIAALSRHLGHSSAAFTLKVYVHYFEKMQKRSAASLDELLGTDRRKIGGFDDVDNRDKSNPVQDLLF